MYAFLTGSCIDVGSWRLGCRVQGKPTIGSEKAECLQ